MANDMQAMKVVPSPMRMVSDAGRIVESLAVERRPAHLWIHRLSERLGRVVAWLVLAMILVGAFNAVGRYLGRFTGLRLSSNAYLEAQWYLFSLVFLLGAGYTLRRNAHVRVDVIYGRLSERTQAWINLLGSLFFLIPFCLFAIWMSWPAVRDSWAVHEVSPDPGGLPRYPIKTMIPIAFALLGLQGVAEALDCWRFLRGRLEGKTTGEGSRAAF